MSTDLFQDVGRQLRQARQRRRLTQPALATRVGRNQARISELERDLLNARLGRDRLTLLLEICDALDLVPLLAPRARAAELRAALDMPPAPPAASGTGSTFDDVFIDLTAGDD
jgi:transcriptional regulator with XRE-family HTH domain